MKKEAGGNKVTRFIIKEISEAHSLHAWLYDLITIALENLEASAFSWFKKGNP